MQSKDTTITKLRQFIRHPSSVPIRVALDRVQDPSLSHPCDQLHNVSLGGLAFRSPKPLANQQIVNISFPLLDETHRFHGRVVWSRKLKQGYDIGLQFDDEEQMYRLRMIEQICHIEHYREQVLQQQGRSMTIEQAAKEWISQYADGFPSL